MIGSGIPAKRLEWLEKDAKLGVGRVFFSKSDEIKSLFDTTIQEVGL